jgi:hypothetical protein
MAGAQTQRNDGAFIVRIWWERGDPVPSVGDNPEEAGHWRGWIQHARSGEHAYFTSLRDMSDFIERETGMPPADERALGLV